MDTEGEGSIRMRFGSGTPSSESSAARRCPITSALAFVLGQRQGQEERRLSQLVIHPVREECIARI